MIIDIGTTVWNRPEMTALFLYSLVTSKIKNYRLFILDQGSEKETYNVIRNMCKDRPNWIHVRLDSNIGACAGRMYLYQLMQSEYCVLTDNDIVLPETYSLDPQIKVLDDNTDVQCVVPRPTTAGGKGTIVGKSMNFQPFKDDLCYVDVAGTLMQMHRRENLISAKAYNLPGQVKWSVSEHIISKNFIAQGWKYVCLMHKWVDVQEQNETWGYRKEDVHDRYDRGARVWDKRPVIHDRKTLEPLWHKEKYEDWEQSEKYIRNKPV